MSDGFYRAFEEKYYAPRELIKILRRQYSNFYESIASLYKGGETFDAGCGRGEWLELMAEQNLLPKGVDLDDGMLSSCQELGLNASKGDAIEHIKKLQSESQAIVTAFHVVEHISFSQLQTFVSEALRVLKPGGLLIMETPNPENVVVATRNFYLDPTHNKPIPHQLLAFVAEYTGFAKVKVIRLQESSSLIQKKDITLLDVFNGVSPDYAVVAQKDADLSILNAFEKQFSIDYGVSQDDLLNRFDKCWQDRFDNLLRRLEENEEAVRKSEEQLNALYNSASWRITAPLRKICKFFRRI